MPIVSPSYTEYFDPNAETPRTGNLTEINQSLDLLWRNNINPAKVVMGLGFYGRSFQLASPSCTAPGCGFSGKRDGAAGVIHDSHETTLRTCQCRTLHQRTGNALLLGYVT